jgi:anti-sigma regulatory factor (Ser/Thr protein kinase)
VQRGTLPTDLPRIPGVDFFSSYEPISQVGGDIYDIMDLGNNKIGIFIGDVSGHGLAPAFVGAMIKMALVDHAYHIHSPKQLFSIMNKNLIQHLKSGHYLTAFYGILDLSSHRFTYSKASHPNPVLIRSNGQVIELETGGMFLGLIEEPGYEEKSIHLKKGDRIYLFTDGYFEIKNQAGDQFTYTELRDLIQSLNHIPKKRTHAALTQHLKRQTGEEELEDDRTFLVMEITDEPRNVHLLEQARDDKEIVKHIYSTESEFDIIFNEMEEFLMKRLPSSEDRRRISICAIELSNNALEHGNKGDTSKKVQMAYKAGADMMVLTIKDEGEGFAVDDLKNPLEGENWRRERGRGIFIVRAYMDEVYFNKKGNMVTVVLYINKYGDDGNV